MIFGALQTQKLESADSRWKPVYCVTTTNNQSQTTSDTVAIRCVHIALKRGVVGAPHRNAVVCCSLSMKA